MKGTSGTETGACATLPHVSFTSISEAGDGPQTAAVAIRCHWGFLRGTFFFSFEIVLLSHARGAGMEGVCWKCTFTPHECSGFQCGREAPALALLRSPQTSSTQPLRDPYLLSSAVHGSSPRGRVAGVPTSFTSGLGFCCTWQFFFFLLVFLVQVAFSSSPKLPRYYRPNPCSAPGSCVWKCCDRFSSLVFYSM